MVSTTTSLKIGGGIVASLTESKQAAFGQQPMFKITFASPMIGGTHAPTRRRLKFTKSFSMKTNKVGTEIAILIS